MKLVLNRGVHHILTVQRHMLVLLSALVPGDKRL